MLSEAYFICEQGSAEQLTTHYLLSDAVYSEAEILIGDTVCLWLGVSMRNGDGDFLLLISYLWGWGGP